MVLRDTWYCSPCVVTSLDIYDSEPASLAAGLDCHADSSGSGSRSFIPSVGRHEPYSVDLREVTAVGFHLESRRFQFAFYVERSDDRPLLFAAESDLEMRCWVAALRMLADKVIANCTVLLLGHSQLLLLASERSALKLLLDSDSMRRLKTVVTCKIKHLQKCFTAVDFPRLCRGRKML